MTKKKENKNDKKTIRVFGIDISSGNFFALILCVIIGIVMLFRTLYINEKLSANTVLITAEVIDIRWRVKGTRIRGYVMDYRYYINGNEFNETTGIQRNERDKINVGDCIEVIVSLEDINVQRWNKSKGAFKCRKITFW